MVFNTLNFSRSGLITVYIDHQIVPRGTTAGIFDSSGNRYPAQALSSRSDGTYWTVWLKDIPPFGFRKYFIRALKEEQAVTTVQPEYLLENKWYKLTADPVTGCIRSLLDKDLNIELVDQSSGKGLGEFILEQLGNRSQMEQKKFTDFKRFPLDSVWFDSMTGGAVFSSIRFYGESATAEKPRGFMIEFRLYNSEKRIEINCSLVKKDIISPESFYIAFPFSLAGGQHFTELQGGVISTGTDQIKGSSNDWYTVQDFTAIRNNSAQIVFGCTEMPLMQFGAINTGRYVAGATPQGTHIFSWPMNNYWVTNFNADQRGGHSWTYYLTSSGDISNGFSTRFGWGSRVPFLTRVIPGNGSGGGKEEGSFISGWPSDIILVSSCPLDKTGTLLIHVRETEGQKSSIKLRNDFTGKDMLITESDATGRVIEGGSTELKAYESKFFIVKESNN